MSENSVHCIHLTIGIRFQGIPILNKERVSVFSEYGETDIKIAKRFRKKEADKINIKPSELYWAIFDNLDDEKPRIHSENYNPGNLVSTHSFMMIGV